MNTKAQFDVARKMIYWGIASFVIAVVILGFVLIINNYKNRLTNTPAEVKAELISLRFTHNPDCFVYEDQKTKRTFLGVVDLAKWTQQRLDACYKTEPEYGYRDFNFRLVLASNVRESLKTNNYFNADQFTVRKEILVYDKGDIQKDELIIYVQESIPGRPRT